MTFKLSDRRSTTVCLEIAPFIRLATRMVRRDVPGAFLLPLVCIIAIFHIDQVKAEVRLLCGMVKDWFPSGSKPQNSQPPYLLNMTDSEGRSVYDDLYMGEPHYGPGQRTYTSE